MIIYSGTNRKNAIINGNFNIWQRGTSFAAIANNEFMTDRFYYGKSGAMVHTVTRDTDVPSGINANYSLKLDCTTADGSITVTDNCAIAHRIEGYNFLPFVGKTATLSFYVKATKPGIYCVGFQNNIDRSYIAEYTINDANTWEKKTITIKFNYSGGTWNYTNDLGLKIAWVIASGTALQSTKDTWLNDNYFATSNQVNGCDSTSNNFWLSQVQFEIGSEASQFQHKSIYDEILECQRYFSKSYDIITNPGTATTTGQEYFYLSGAANSDHDMYIIVNLPTRMRTNPTIVLYDQSGNSGKVTMIAGDNITGTSNNIAETHFNVSGTNGSASIIRLLAFQWTANAEI